MLQSFCHASGRLVRSSHTFLNVGRVSASLPRGSDNISTNSKSVRQTQIYCRYVPLHALFHHFSNVWIFRRRQKFQFLSRNSRGGLCCVQTGIWFASVSRLAKHSDARRSHARSDVLVTTVSISHRSQRQSSTHQSCLSMHALIVILVPYMHQKDSTPHHSTAQHSTAEHA